MQFTEDHNGISVEQFGKKVLAVLSTALPILGIPLILAEQCTVRIAALPNNFRNAAEYLARSVFRVRPEDLEYLGRPTSFFGFRLVFPPAPQHSNNFNVRVECYVRDGRSLYIENVGSFKAPIQPTGHETIEKNIQATSDFLVEKVVKFLSVYDRRDSE